MPEPKTSPAGLTKEQLEELQSNGQTEKEGQAAAFTRTESPRQPARFD